MLALSNAVGGSWLRGISNSMIARSSLGELTIEKLVLVGKVSTKEVDKPKAQDREAATQHAVHEADDEDQDGLWKVKCIAEFRWCQELRII